jgi:hypothetical protein
MELLGNAATSSKLAAFLGNSPEILERINAVGMAVQIIEGVPGDNPLNFETKAEMARLLLQGTQASMSAKKARPFPTRPKSKAPKSS